MENNYYKYIHSIIKTTDYEFIQQNQTKSIQ